PSRSPAFPYTTLFRSPKAAELVALTSEGRDDPHHCHRLEHNRQGLPLKPTNLLDPWHDPSGVDPDRVIHDRDYRQSEQGEDWVRSEEHTSELQSRVDL